MLPSHLTFITFSMELAGSQKCSLFLSANKLFGSHGLHRITKTGDALKMYCVKCADIHGTMQDPTGR